jgi:hypothetical protein
MKTKDFTVKIVWHVSMSPDGFIAAPNDSLEARVARVFLTGYSGGDTPHNYDVYFKLSGNPLRQFMGFSKMRILGRVSISLPDI